MSLTVIARRTEVLFSAYEGYLEKITDMDFQQQPAPGAWSYAEVFSHVYTANQACFMAIENCIKDKAEVTTQKASLPGRIILWTGIFPPVKIKAPKRIAAMVQKITKEDAARHLQQLRDMLQRLLPDIPKAAPNQKAVHPRMGYFDAKQWLRFIEIHTRHHLKQLQRIEKSLKTSR